MSESMVPDFMTFTVDALRQIAELFGLDSNQKECSWRMLSFEDIENFRGPLRIGTVVKSNGELVFAGAITGHAVGLGEALEVLPVDESGLLVDGEFALAVRRPRLDVQDFAFALHIDVLAGRNVFQPIGRISFSGHIPHAPEGAVFRTQPPQSEGLDAERLRGTHLVQGGDRIEKPDIVAEVIVVAVAEMRVKRIAVEINVFFGIARPDPGFLHGNALVSQSRRKLAFLGPLDPVVPVVADGTDELLFRNLLDRGFQVRREPVLRSDRTRGSAGKVLVIVHDD